MYRAYFAFELKRRPPGSRDMKSTYTRMWDFENCHFPISNLLGLQKFLPNI